MISLISNSIKTQVLGLPSIKVPRAIKRPIKDQNVSHSHHPKSRKIEVTKKSEEKDPNFSTCRVCNQNISLKDLVSHMETHSAKRKCDNCGKWVSNLEEHTKLKHSKV